MIVLDIETKPAPIETINEFMPEMKADSRLKDQVKIAADIQKKKEAFIEKAPLNTTTLEIFAVGFFDSSTDEYELFTGEEATVLTRAFAYISDSWDDTFVSFYGNYFDLPNLMRRGWINGLNPPMNHLYKFGGRYTKDNVVDLYDLWQLGSRDSTGGLATIAKALKVTPKVDLGDKLPHEIYEADSVAFKKYLKGDLQTTFECAVKMGLL